MRLSPHAPQLQVLCRDWAYNRPMSTLPSRRTMVQGAAVLAGSITAAAPDMQAATTQSKVWSAEYWAQKGAVKLYMFRKRAGAPKLGEAPRPALMLVHGSSNSARSSYDLTPPGHGEYSVMNVFAEYGFDVWTMDHEN